MQNSSFYLHYVWAKTFLHSRADIQIAVTLTMKQAVHNGTPLPEYLTRDQASVNVKHFLRRLNDEVYGNAARRHGKKLDVISSIEGDAGKDGYKRLHAHLAIQFPPRLNIDNQFHHLKFKSMIDSCWLKTKWGYERTDYQICSNAYGWISYIIKEGSDSIDLQNIHLSE